MFSRGLSRPCWKECALRSWIAETLPRYPDIHHFVSPIQDSMPGNIPSDHSLSRGWCRCRSDRHGSARGALKLFCVFGIAEEESRKQSGILGTVLSHSNRALGAHGRHIKEHYALVPLTNTGTTPEIQLGVRIVKFEKDEHRPPVGIEYALWLIVRNIERMAPL